MAVARWLNHLEAENFRVTDNGVAQQISHFDLGGDPISMVILIETSSRIEPLMPADSQNWHFVHTNCDGADW